MLRARLQATPEAAAELHAAIEQIQVLWEELQAQSEALASERQRHAEFFEFAPDAYVITDPNGEIREANRCARELLGLKPDRIDGTSLAAFLHDGERAAFRARLVTARGRPDGEIEEWESRLDGAGEPVRFRVRPIKVRRKNAGGLCWLLRKPA